jgi:hypothetical protein
VHLADRPGVLALREIERSLSESGHLVKLDATTNGQPQALLIHAGKIELEGFGVAVVTNEFQP